MSPGKGDGAQTDMRIGVIPHALQPLYFVLQHTVYQIGEKLSDGPPCYAHVCHVPGQRGRRAVSDVLWIYEFTDNVTRLPPYTPGDPEAVRRTINPH